MKKNIFILLGILILIPLLYLLGVLYQKLTSKNIMPNDSQILNLENRVNKGELQKIVFAGGCFWCTEASFDPEFGVEKAYSGYFGGQFPNPTYEQVSNHETDHREAVIIYYNNASTSLRKLLVNYWHHIDPTQTDGQFHDIGYQYTTAIYHFTDDQKKLAEESKKILEDSKKFDKKIAVEILSGKGLTFYPAEEYHQDYSAKNPLRYEYYKKGSGRTDFVKENWKDDQTFKFFLESQVVESKNISDSGEINRTNTPTSEMFSNSTPSPSGKSWKNFTKEMKEKKLAELSPLQVKVTQHEGTEPPFKNEYDKNYEKGIYVDIVSGEPLFLSTDKYDSGTGWPSFVKPISDSVVNLKTDYYLFYPRTEVRSKIADSHLGHVFDDGPVDRGGKRYCMNSAALKFIPMSEMKSAGYGEYLGYLD